jgi:signal transduction histidine kinase
VLFVGLAIVWAGFLIENSIMLLSSHAERGEASALLQNALPSVRSLADSRSQVLRICGCLAEGGSRQRVAGCISAARAAMGRSFGQYERLPMYPGEPEAFDKARQALRALDGRIDQQLGGGLDSSTGAREGMVSAVFQVDERLQDVISLNVRHAREHAAAIERHRRFSTWFEFALDCLAVVVVTVATLFALRSARRYMTFLEDRAAELDQFSSRVAHDLISPLGTAALALSRGTGEVETVPSTRRAEIALASLRRVRSLVDALLEFARAGARPSGERVSVDELLGSLLPELEQQALEANVDLSLEERPPPFVEVACAPGVLTSIVSNLVRNAIKFMGESQTRAVNVRVMPRPDMVRFEVEDTGPGIPSEMQDLIFEPYARVAGTGQPGLGMGLATVKRLVTAHGGAVGVRSETGRGALFWFELPRSNRFADAPSPSPPAQP